MRFGMFDTIRWHHDLSAERTLADVLEQIDAADRLGIQDIWLGEHHFSRHGILSGIFSFMGAVAARTRTARIGTAIVVLPFHNPVQVAEESATLDIISNGRFNLGVGAGYQAREFHGMGVNIEESREIFAEYLDVVRRCWEDGPTTYRGRYVDIEDIWVIPKPIQRPGPPIYIAVSTSPESVDYAAKLGVPIIVGGPTTTLGQTPQVVRLWHERMERYGHPHEHVDPPVSVNIYVAPTMEEAERDIAGLEARIDEEFHRVGNPADKGREHPRQLQALGPQRPGQADSGGTRSKGGHPPSGRNAGGRVRADRGAEVEGDQPDIRQVRRCGTRAGEVAPMHRDVRHRGDARVRRQPRTRARLVRPVYMRDRGAVNDYS